MRLHSSVIQKLLRIVDLHAGRKDNKKLTNAFENLDLSAYSQKENAKKETFLVLSEALDQAAN